MKHGTVEDARRAWNDLPWQLQTGCTGCQQQALCHGKSRYKVLCLACYVRANMRKVDVRKLERAGVL